MVTDLSSNYTSPAGKEFTFAAARFAGITPASRVLDMGCGYGEGACNLARDFRCHITALDLSQENIDYGRESAIKAGVSHLVNFSVGDVMQTDFAQEPFELVLAEGGFLSFIGRKAGLDKMVASLQPRGWIAFSDLIFLSDKAPDDVRAIFEDKTYHYESEPSYRALVKEAGLDIHFMALVPQSGWDNYYAHMARRLEDEKGFFGDRRIKLAFHKEIDVFYRLEGFRWVGYLYCVARKR